MRGWIVLYCFSWGWILPKHYKTEKMAQKFAAEHRALGCEAVVIPANYPEFPDSCLGLKLTFCINIIQMFINGSDIFLK